MSKPKRYDHFIKVYSKSFVDEVGTRYCYPDAGMTESVEGKYVEWEDYARLKAEVERLRASSFVTAVPSEEYERMKEQYQGIIDQQALQIGKKQKDSNN